MIRYNGAGLNGANNLPLKLIRERATTVGCVEPKIEGYCYGHTNANITNLGNILSLTLTNGILPEGCPGYGAGTRIGCESGDPLTFKTFEEFYMHLCVSINIRSTFARSICLLQNVFLLRNIRCHYLR